MILGKSDVVNTDNEGVSNIMVEDSCCVSVGVICDIVSVDTSGMSVKLGENNTVNGVAEGVSVSLTGKTNDEDSCCSVGNGTIDWVVILGENDVINTDTEGVSNKSIEVIKVVENSC